MSVWENELVERIINMDKIILLLIVYISLYVVIWLHEVGHALMYSRYGCKGNPFKVSVRPYIFFSTPLPINLDKVKDLSLRQKHNVAIAGVTMNMLFGIPSALLLILGIIDINSYLSILFVFFCTLHLIEAITYTVINNIFLASDMKEVDDYNRLLRIPYFLIGCILLWLSYQVYIIVPINLQSWVLITNLIIGLGMGIARVVFQILINREKNIA